MKQSEIVKGNKFIAEFIGWKFKKGKFISQLSNSSGEYYDSEVEEKIWWDEDDFPMEGGLEFHRSWNKLMIVVDKIKRFPITSQSKGCKVGDIFGDRFEMGRNTVYWDFYKWTKRGWEHKNFYHAYNPDDVTMSDADSYIQAVWKTCLQFIKWSKIK